MNQRSTPRYPMGQISPDDEGETNIGVAADVKNGVVRIQFSKPIVWLAMPPSHAKELAKIIIQNADKVLKGAN